MSCMKASEYNNGAVRGLGCFKDIDIYNGKPEGTRDIMALIKTLNNPGGLWTWQCEVTHLQRDLLSTALSSLFPFSAPSFYPPSFLFFLLFFTFFFYHTSYKLFPSFPSPTPSVFMQLHQLRWRMSATTIMPFEGTTEDEERDWTRGAGGGGPSEKRRPSFLADGWRLDGQMKHPMESKHETFCIVLHQTTARWDHINSQSVCLLSRCSQLIGPTMN